MNFLMNRFGSKRTTTTAIVSTVVTAVLAYKAYKAYKSYTARPRVKPPPAFENTYFKEYDELEDDPRAPVPLPHDHVRETTPQGDIIMTYDATQSVFCYYCDKRSVQFKYLEPVARKYVIAHKCKRLYIDFRKQLTNAKLAPAATAPVATAPTTAPVTNSSIFAQLKKYSQAPGKGRNANEERACVLKEHVTRYLYCGRLDEFKRDATTPTEDPQHDFSIIKPIDYASYKKMNDYET